MSNSSGTTTSNCHFQCRACGTELTWMMADLGTMPLANAYLDGSSINNEKSYPLQVMVCSECHLAQVTTAVPPSDIFSEYSYFSSFSSSWLKHAQNYCNNIQKARTFDADSLIIEVASNDGYLLKNFVEKGIPVLGIEPAKNIATEANKRGIRTISEFLGSASATELTDHYGRADLVIANNVLAHVPDIGDFIDGLSVILKDDGLLTVEFPHLLKLLQHCQFDTIYHEHYSYLSLLTVSSLFRQAGLRIHDVEQLDTHGGSLRIHASHEHQNRSVTPAVTDLHQEEINSGLKAIQTYKDFSLHIQNVKQTLCALIQTIKSNNQRVICYGAAAKGNTLLNFCKLDASHIDYVVDLNPNKQDRLMPGSHIPIVAPDKIKVTQPDYILILPWNLTNEITQQLNYCREWGAKFIIPIPKPEIF